MQKMVRWVAEHRGATAAGLATAVVLGLTINVKLGVAVAAIIYYFGGIVYVAYYAAVRDIDPGQEWWLAFIFAWPLVLLYYRAQIGSRRCPACSKQVRHDAHVCHRCGRDLEAAGSPAAAGPAPASPSSPGAGLADRLAHVDQLHSEGTLTDDEHRAARARIIGEL